MELLEDRRVLAAMIQLIHNSPYTEAQVVDVYVNDQLLLDDFAFREATPYVEVPSSTDLKVDITAGSAADNAAPLFSQTINLQDGGTYVAVAIGDPLNRPENPSFRLRMTDQGRTTATDPGAVDVLAFHGAVNYPVIDIVASDQVVFNDLAYQQFSSDYVSVAPRLYNVKVTNAVDNRSVYASYWGDLRPLQGQAVVVTASGFVSPEADEPGIGLLVVSPDGNTSLLPSTDAPPARLQIVHNSPYAAAALVDVYVNEELLLDDVAFRSASPFVDIPANFDIQIDITAADAADNSSPIYSTTVNLEASAYVAIAGGDPSGEAGQPAFGLAILDMAREAAQNPANAEAMIFHGSPDAPTVDIFARGVGKVVDNLSYGEFIDAYLSVPPANYTLDIAASSNTVIIVASFDADLNGAAGVALVVAASGFLSPAAETDPAFGLLAIYPDGTTALLPTAAEPAPVPGDSNHDGKFDHQDLVQVMAAGKYNTGEPATFEEGDWSRDGVFDTTDFVCVFAVGNYMNGELATALVASAVESAFADDDSQ